MGLRVWHFALNDSENRSRIPDKRAARGGIRASSSIVDQEKGVMTVCGSVAPNNSRPLQVSSLGHEFANHASQRLESLAGVPSHE